MKKLNALCVLIISVLLSTNLVGLISAQIANGNGVNVQLITFGGGQASLTTEKTLISAYSAKLLIPSSAPEGSGCMALYPYDNTLNSISSFTVITSYMNASPRFVIYLDTNNDGAPDLALVSDYQFTSNGNWQITQGGNRWGWSEAGVLLSTYGKTWNTIDYWRNQYGNTQVLSVGIALEYWGVKDSGGLDQPLFADELILNGITYNIISATNPNSGPTITQSINAVLDTRAGAQASITNENVHTDPYSVKLVIPSNLSRDPCAMALYPYNKSFSTLNSFSVWVSFNLAVPRFVIYLDSNNDGATDIILLSDYQFVSNGQWQITTGGQRWGWTETNYQINGYGTTWNQLDYWKNIYGNYTALYVGICLEYWAVYDRGGCDQPLYADEVIINGIAYSLTSNQTSTISPSPTPTPSTPPTATATQQPIVTEIPTPPITTAPTPQVTSPQPTQPATAPKATISPQINAVAPQSTENLSDNWILLAAIVASSLIAATSMVFIFRKGKGSEK